jgi:hypothetical protein
MNTQSTNYYTYNRVFAGFELKNCELKQKARSLPTALQLIHKLHGNEEQPQNAKKEIASSFIVKSIFLRYR